MQPKHLSGYKWEIYNPKESQTMILPLKSYIIGEQLDEALFSLRPVLVNMAQNRDRYPS